MKKYFLSLMALVLGMSVLHANPVDFEKAKSVGEMFAKTSLETRGSDLTLVRTFTTLDGEDCFYVFNIGNEGYVIVSANDYYRPIIGYSNEGPIDLSIPNVSSYLNSLCEARSYRHVGAATPEAAAEWERVTKTGRLLKVRSGGSVGPLCQTKWDQNYPYNYYCPANSAGPGGHVYAGCVASAMAQVMKYWNHPVQGTGSHTNPHGGSANFGQTTYDWDNMPNAITASSPQEQIDAIATLMYHCGISVDMSWAPDGSGAFSQDVPVAIRTYFSYATQAVYQARSGFNATAWIQKVRESLDMGWPVYYSGQSTDAGHAYVVDGYNDEGRFWFNYGWGGSSNGWYTFDENEFHISDGAIFNYVPQEVYNNTPQAPISFNVNPADNYQLSATLSWTNPSKTLSNANLNSIESVVIKRDNVVIAVLDNATPGASMTYVDNEVPRYDYFNYQVYVVANDSHGKCAYVNDVAFGPECNWAIMMTSTNFLGFRGGYISVYNGAGTLVQTATTVSSSPATVQVSAPVGRLSFGWTAGETVDGITFIIKDSNNNSVFNFSGSTADLEEGIFFVANNGCGNAAPTQAPSNLFAVRDDDDPYTINVSWDGVSENGYGYNVYRDELLYRTVPNATSFVDTDVEEGGHCYYATFLGFGGESDEQSNESCANAGEGCNPATNLDYTTFGSQFKIKLLWEKPENDEGLSGYYVFRKPEGGDWKRIKVIGNPNTTNYTDNSLNEEGKYYYKVQCYYDATECLSAPANWIYDTNQFWIGVYWSPTSVVEMGDGVIQVYPNPTKDQVTVSGEGMQQVMVFNTLGQLVYSSYSDSDNTVVNLSGMESGLYMVKVLTQNGEYMTKISVIR